jgi:hypothetical protein
LEKFVETLQYKPGITEDGELFTFGVDLGDGSENDHFHLGFTSKKLLQNIQLLNDTQNGIYHLD